MASWTGDFDTRGLRGQREEALTVAAFELCRPCVNASHQNLGARRTGELLFLPLSSRKWVFDLDMRIAQLAGQLSEPWGQQAIALRAGQWRRSDLGFHNQFFGHGHHFFFE